MKAKQIFIFLAGLYFTLLSYPTLIEAQDNPPDSCLKYPVGTLENSYWNPDSVKIDSCWDSPTFGQMYATKFKLQFKRWFYIFKTKPFIMDSLYTWEDIDSNHLELKNFFRYDVELIFGEFQFQRHPLWIDDASFIEVPTVLLIFNYYVHGETLINFFSQLHFDIEYVKINQIPVFNSVIEPEKPNKEYTITISDNDKLNIERNVFDSQSINVFIYDLMGNLIAKHIEKNESETIQIDISSLQTGLYFVVINNKYVYKLIKY